MAVIHARLVSIQGKKGVKQKMRYRVYSRQEKQYRTKELTLIQVENYWRKNSQPVDPDSNVEKLIAVAENWGSSLPECDPKVSLGSGWLKENPNKNR